ncbi:(2Fe-2S) ferredoxin domain-containing protein [Clostridium sp. DJ247]|uniref:(2Fe-2S) ferredoxin domain-containing protein n=1 Tax=Clostridium sp. DJ247 TaxID=2726188 RepID=UPI00162A8BA6|nr:(2Fe-2S) ferredoxin domain-containing protein [Clostridium sp. DJ247]MBC2582817.1 (2Fe-2S) ferredoxin domain-containing protein [Clostridium sp. DJ247]
MVTINVCVGSACHLKGSYDIIEAFQQFIETYKLKDKVELKGAFCLSHCTEGVSVKFDDEDTIYSLRTTNVESFFKEQVMGRIS